MSDENEISVERIWETDSDSVTIDILSQHGMARRICDIRTTSCEYGADADGNRGEMRRESEVCKVRTVHTGEGHSLLHLLPDEHEMLDYWTEHYHE